jgi:hypothetical protein
MQPDLFQMQVKIDAGPKPQPPKLQVMLMTNCRLFDLWVFPSPLAGFQLNLQVLEQPNLQLSHFIVGLP